MKILLTPAGSCVWNTLFHRGVLPPFGSAEIIHEAIKNLLKFNTQPTLSLVDVMTNANSDIGIHPGQSIIFHELRLSHRNAQSSDNIRLEVIRIVEAKNRRTNTSNNLQRGQSDWMRQSVVVRPSLLPDPPTLGHYAALSGENRLAGRELPNKGKFAYLMSHKSKQSKLSSSLPCSIVHSTRHLQTPLLLRLSNNLSLIKNSKSGGK